MPVGESALCRSRGKGKGDSEALIQIRVSLGALTLLCEGGEGAPGASAPSLKSRVEANISANAHCAPVLRACARPGRKVDEKAAVSVTRLPLREFALLRDGQSKLGFSLGVMY